MPILVSICALLLVWDFWKEIRFHASISITACNFQPAAALLVLSAWRNGSRLGAVSFEILLSGKQCVSQFLVAVTKYQGKLTKFGKFISTHCFRVPGFIVSSCGEVQLYGQGVCWPHSSSQDAEKSDRQRPWLSHSLRSHTLLALFLLPWVIYPPQNLPDPNSLFQFWTPGGWTLHRWDHRALMIQSSLEKLLQTRPEMCCTDSLGASQFSHSDRGCKHHQLSRRE